MSLTSKGLLRWYATCCKTPIANTPRNFKIAHVGVIHACIDGGPNAMAQSFGPVRLRVHTKSANRTNGTVEPNKNLVGIAGRHLAPLVRRRVKGEFRQTPFFDKDDGLPVKPPHVLDRSEWERLRKAL